MSDPTDPNLTELAHTGGGWAGLVSIVAFAFTKVVGESKLMKKLEQVSSKLDALDKKLAVRTQADAERDRRLDGIEAAHEKGFDRIDKALEQLDERMRALEDFRSRESGIRHKDGG